MDSTLSQSPRSMMPASPPRHRLLKKPMFRKPIRIQRPDLRDEVHELVDQVAVTRVAEKMPVEELLRVLGLRVAPDFHDQLVSRGDLFLGEETFHNSGEEIRRQVTLLGIGVNLYIPPVLSGSIARFSNSFQLVFREDYSVTASKLLFALELRHLDVSRERIFADFHGASDLYIDLSEVTPG